MRAAVRYSLPSFVQADSLLDAGALVFQSVSWTEQCRRHAAFIDNILRGAKPADIPVEQPTKFELRINLKTAKALNLTIPHSLLVRADVVIQ
jgi:putative tryptophan/tyrosine transport system substrate-binding protein